MKTVTLLGSFSTKQSQIPTRLFENAQCRFDPTFLRTKNIFAETRHLLGAVAIGRSRALRSQFAASAPAA